MKKQIINKVLVALLISTAAMPAYGNHILKTVGALTGFTVGATALVGLPVAAIFGVYGGTSALIGKIIIDRISGNNNQQNNNNANANILISGLIGGGLAGSIPEAMMGAGIAYLYNKAYDLKYGSNRDYNSNRTAFMSGALAAATLAEIAAFSVLIARHY